MTPKVQYTAVKVITNFLLRSLIVRPGLSRWMYQAEQKGKDRDKDRWISSIQTPFERVLSKRNPRVRYRGRVKNSVRGVHGCDVF